MIMDLSHEITVGQCHQQLKGGKKLLEVAKPVSQHSPSPAANAASVLQTNSSSWRNTGISLDHLSRIIMPFLKVVAVKTVVPSSAPAALVTVRA